MFCIYKLELCVTNGTNDEMTCVVFNEAAVSLLKISADELVNKSLSEPRSISTTADTANPPSAGVLQIDEETEMCAKIKDVEWEMADELFSSLVDNVVTPSKQSSVIVGNGRDASLSQSVVQPRSISTSVDAATPPSAGVLQIDEETEMCAKIKDVEWEMADEVFSSVVDNSLTPSTQSSVTLYVFFFYSQYVFVVWFFVSFKLLIIFMTLLTL
ncbi:hypothetical protein HanXRQr2_Chr06g0254411 [Helianthus annuus]|uniref:Nucleic acid-binding, OB-fold protein n=1 Tax=Helianthus annuus TaxID=4232 RepID=A0A9K3NJM5_HELAN|nr:hypothetical protein HanXRQr2_Chr06g0254411 [Helianthus annuus]KAJ0740507.1 hypothetical protein HanOQP8_Chr06g0217581 [Helianthus annuus]